jgi:twitching motility protein PilU
MASEKDMAEMRLSGDKGDLGDTLSGSYPTLNTRPLFKLMADKRASDLFFTANAPVKIKIDGQILPVNKQVLTPEMARQTIFGLMNREQRERLASELELTFALSEPGLGRFRVTVFLQRGTPAMVMRYIAAEVPRMDQLGLPELVPGLVMQKRGLVLLAGGAGVGKSTTMAALINVRNESSSAHIVTIEDPIEFLHTNKRSMVNQREVGTDTRSFARALRSVEPAAPDVILIGDIRGRQTLSAAIRLAASGHLVLAILHASNCTEALDLVLNLFPREQQGQVALHLSQCLKAILAQRLIMGTDNRRVAVMETMLNTPRICELIKNVDLIGCREAMAGSSERGIQSFDAALHQLYREGRIELTEALAQADSRANLEARINFG